MDDHYTADRYTIIASLECNRYPATKICAHHGPHGSVKVQTKPTQQDPHTKVTGLNSTKLA